MHEWWLIHWIDYCQSSWVYYYLCNIEFHHKIVTRLCSKHCSHYKDVVLGARNVWTIPSVPNFCRSQHHNGRCSKLHWLQERVLSGWILSSGRYVVQTPETGTSQEISMESDDSLREVSWVLDHCVLQEGDNFFVLTHMVNGLWATTI